MLRLMVVMLLASNLLMAGVHVASEPTDPTRPVVSLPPNLADVPRLQLLDELDPEARAALNPRQCFSAGPFETVPTMIRAREALGSDAWDIHERETEALVELGYWVALPPMNSFAEAGEALSQLEQAGMTDIAVVNEKEGEYRVSLGYYLEEANARRRRDAVRSLGFQAETRLQRETQVHFWLDYALSDEALADGAAARLPAGQQRKIPCGDQLGP